MPSPTGDLTEAAKAFLFLVTVKKVAVLPLILMRSGSPQLQATPPFVYGDSAMDKACA